MRTRSRRAGAAGLLSLVCSCSAISRTLANPLGQGELQQDTGQVSIHNAGDGAKGSTTPPGPRVAIAATIYAGSAGPATCHGAPMSAVAIPAGDTARFAPAPRCYDLLSGAGSCGTFVANKDDGCEARLFEEPGCRFFVNLVVFMPEARAVGGS